MAAETFIVQGDRDVVTQSRLDVANPGPGVRGLWTLVTRGVERKANHELVDLMGPDELLEGRRIEVDVSSTSERRQRPRAGAWPIGDRDTDAPLPEIDAQCPGHGDAPAVVTSTLESSVGIVPTQSGQTLRSASP